MDEGHCFINLFVPIFDSIDKGGNADGLSKDLSKAFDSVDQNLLLKYGIQSLDLQWLGSYLSGRQQYVKVCHINNKNENRKTKPKLKICILNLEYHRL